MIKANDRVKIAESEAYYDFSRFADRVGVVANVYDFGDNPIATVKFEDDVIARSEIVKVPVKYLVKVEPETEIPEDAKQITKADFAEALARVTDPEAALSDMKSNPIAALTKIMSAKVVGDEAKDKIFKDQDVVTVNEDQFIVMLWNACNPVTVAETTGKRMATRKCIDVAIAAFVSLREIVPILFDESAND